jgi:hypothetical protein
MKQYHMRGLSVGITDGIMVYTVDMGLGAMLYVPNFIKIGSSIQMLLGRIHTETDMQTAKFFIKTFYVLFHNRKSKLKILSYLAESTPYPLQSQLIDSVYENNSFLKGCSLLGYDII